MFVVFSFCLRSMCCYSLAIMLLLQVNLHPLCPVFCLTPTSCHAPIIIGTLACKTFQSLLSISFHRLISIVLALHMTVHNIVFVTSTMSIELHISYIKLDITIIVRILKAQNFYLPSSCRCQTSASPPSQNKLQAVKLAI